MLIIVKLFCHRGEMYTYSIGGSGGEVYKKVYRVMLHKIHFGLGYVFCVRCHVMFIEEKIFLYYVQRKMSCHRT